MDEIEQSIAAFQEYDLVHIRLGPGYLDCKSALVMEAWNNIKEAVRSLEMGITDPADHKAEALLLMILQQAYYHGYTPKTEAT